MTKENKPSDRKPLHENTVPVRKSDRDSVPLYDKPGRRIFDVTDTRPSPENPHRDTNERDKK
jgi:hypothetical protein